VKKGQAQQYGRGKNYEIPEGGQNCLRKVTHEIGGGGVSGASRKNEKKRSGTRREGAS